MRKIIGCCVAAVVGHCCSFWYMVTLLWKQCVAAMSQCISICLLCLCVCDFIRECFKWANWALYVTWLCCSRESFSLVSCNIIGGRSQCAFCVYVVFFQWWQKKSFASFKRAASNSGGHQYHFLACFLKSGEHLISSIIHPSHTTKTLGQLYHFCLKKLDSFLIIYLKPEVA